MTRADAGELFLILFLLFVGALNLSAVASENPEPRSGNHAAFLARIDIEDQRSRPYRYDAERAFRILVVGDRSVSEQTEAWADALEAAFPPNGETLRILDLSDLTRIAAPVVRRKIAKRLGDRDVSVYLDWEGKIAGHFDVPVDVSTVVCLDGDDRLLGVVSGEMTTVRLAEAAAFYGFEIKQRRTSEERNEGKQ